MLSDMSLGKVLKRMVEPFTTHGYRASFRSWAASVGADHEVAELCLAHVQSRLVRAYQRDTLFDQRRELLSQWASFVTGPRSG